jgi:hypothetical protein
MLLNDIYLRAGPAGGFQVRRALFGQGGVGSQVALRAANARLQYKKRPTTTPKRRLPPLCARGVRLAGPARVAAATHARTAESSRPRRSWAKKRALAKASARWRRT